jgi:4a-hydroxytetrahydrobiopterin dehydratase
MAGLVECDCVPCSGYAQALRGAEIDRLCSELAGWDVEHEHHLARTFTFPDFAGALAFANRVGAIADELGHHPDLHVSWGRVRVEVWTHKVDGLTEADFVLASKIDNVLQEDQASVNCSPSATGGCCPATAT